jgi:hypothetical protein
MRVLAALAKEVDPEGAAACVGGHFLSRRHSATFGYIRLHSATFGEVALSAERSLPHQIGGRFSQV